MAFSQTDLDALDQAIKEGVSRVKYSDKEVQYRSLGEMIQLRDLMRRELGLQDSTRRIFAQHTKGIV